MKIINSILTVFSFFIIFAHSGYGAFESSNSAIYLERVEDNKRVLFETGDGGFKSNFEVSLKGELHDKDIGDKILYGKYKIIEFCSNDRCYQDGTINVNGQFIYIDNYTTSVKLKVLARTPELDPGDFTLGEKIKLFFKLNSTNLLIEFALFLPLNLLIFHCLSYFLFLFLYKKRGLTYFSRVHLVSGILYFLSFIIIYTLGVGTLNFYGVLGLFSGSTILYMIKVMMFMVSIHTLIQYNRISNVRLGIHIYVILFYVCPLVLYKIYNLIY